MRLEALLLPAVVSAAALSTRQMGAAKVAGTRTLQPEVNPNAVHTVTKFGPLTVKGKKANSADSGQQNWILSIREGFCKNCTVLKGHVGIEELDGTPADPKTGVYIHHILTFDTTKRSKNFVQGCTGGLAGAVSMMGSKFIGTGEDNNNVAVWYTARDGSSPSGFHIGPSDTFMANVDLVNYANEKKVYLTMELEYLKGNTGNDASETLLSVTGCGVPSIKLSQTGPTNTTSGKYTFTKDGEILGAKGHLHAGGEKMIMFINGKFVCESQAVYGGKKGSQAIDEMTLCSTKPIKVKKGDVMTMQATYDVSKHPVRHESGFGGMPDIMGMFDIIFAGNDKS